MISPENGRAVLWSAMDKGQPSIFPAAGGKRNWLTLRCRRADKAATYRKINHRLTMRTHGRTKQAARVRRPNTQGFSELIRFENVGLRYGMGPEILRDISFHIPQRSFQFLSGPSGAGKTTLLRLLFLSLKPTRGLINVFGKDRSRITRHELPMMRRRIGVVFQDFRLLDHMTTYENVALPLRVRGREEASYRTDVIELLKWVGLGERMHVLPPVLSGGEKQRAAIARALIEQPEILLADEPTGNVDPPLARRLLRLFIELNRLGTAVVIATHDLGLMEQVDARRMILSGGRLDIYD
jgi:cell division transport system ATP-binding protein